MKVLLDTSPVKHRHAWKISSKNGLIIRSFEYPYQKKEFPEEVTIHLRKGNIFINSKKLTLNQNLSIEPLHEIITVNNASYNGILQLIKDKDNFLLINKVNLEEYIFSVLKTESWPGWPLEINKVLAIACRSYAISKLLEAKRKKLAYHIKPTNLHQTYSGIHFNEILRQATLETAGIIMSYDNKPILAMFDCCCGSVIPAHIKETKNIPYLSRNYACEFCKKCSIYNWEFEIKTSEFLNQLKKEIKFIKNLHEIKIHLDKAGLVEKAIIKDGKKLHIISGKKFYSLFKEIKSFAFNIKKDQQKFTIKGTGYGHHLGLCQWGARQMINEGWKYKDILKFYYPGINFCRIKS